MLKEENKLVNKKTTPVYLITKNTGFINNKEYLNTVCLLFILRQSQINNIKWLSGTLTLFVAANYSGGDETINNLL